MPPQLPDVATMHRRSMGAVAAGQLTQVALRLAVFAAIYLAAGGAAPPTAGAVTVVVDENGTIWWEGERRFPLGLSHPPGRFATTPWGRPALQAVADAGATLFRVGPISPTWGARRHRVDRNISFVRKWNASAARVGAFTWVHLGRLTTAVPGTVRARALEKIVTAMRDDPGLGMWKGYDEPNLHGVPAWALRYAYRTVRRLENRHPYITIQAPVGQASALVPYAAVTDLQGVDVYPVRYGKPHPDLHTVGRWTSLLRSVTPGGAVTTTIQVCHGKAWDRKGSGRFVVPTLRQERFMAYDAIINGARAIMFFGARNRHCFTALDERFGWNWTFWYAVVKPLLRELAPGGRLYRALLYPKSGVGITCSDRATGAISRHVGDIVWVIAARHGDGTKTVRIGGLPTSIRMGRSLHGHLVKVRRGAFTVRLSRYAVGVYRFHLPS
jgi:hypothetical protein